jgi:hypothetical protein
MKKLLLLAVTVVTGLTMSACSSLEDFNNAVSTLSSSESLAVLSYVSGSMLDTETIDPNASSNLTFLNETDEPTIYDEIEDINVYVDRLKVFIESGTEDFGNIQAQVSDNPDYMFEINITIEGNLYVLYYNIDETGTLSGEMVIGEETYELTVLENKLEDKNELDVDDDDIDTDDEADDELDTEDSDHDDDENDVDTEEDSDDENEVKMTLLATNGENTIRVKYKAETEENESKTVIEMEKNMNGVESFSSIEIKEEENEYKVTVREDGLELQFKAENEDGETEYKLTYSNEGVEGEIRIKAEYNEEGELVYRYQIREDGKNYQYEKGAPRSRGYNPVEEDESETEEETEDTETGDNV